MSSARWVTWGQFLGGLCSGHLTARHHKCVDPAPTLIPWVGELVWFRRTDCQHGYGGHPSKEVAQRCSSVGYPFTMYAVPTIRQLSEGTGLVGDPRQQQALQEAARQHVTDTEASVLLPNIMLNEPLSKATHLIVSYLRASNEAAAGKLSHAAISLRGLYSHLTSEELSEPYETDVLVSDVNELTIPSCIMPQLHEHGMGPEEFGAATERAPAFPVQGILFGAHLRPVVTLIFELDDRKVQLPVLIDPTGQLTQLNADSWRLLAPTTDTGSWHRHTHRTVSVHGVNVAVYLGQGPTQGVNLVGKDWLRAAGVLFVCGYLCEGCVIMRESEELRNQVPNLRGIA